MTFYKEQSKHLLLTGDFNWDIYGNENLTKSYSIAKEPGCQDSAFGDRHHIKWLLDTDHLSYDKFTDKGIEMLSGLYCRKFYPDNNDPFILISFDS